MVSIKKLFHTGGIIEPGMNRIDVVVSPHVGCEEEGRSLRTTVS